MTGRAFSAGKLIAFLFGALATAAPALNSSERVASAGEPLAETTPDPAWDTAFDRHEGWIGGDAIYSTPLPGGDVLWLFADTYIGQVRNHRRQSGVRIVNNTLGLQVRRAGSPAFDPPKPEELTFRWDTSGGLEGPRAWIRPAAVPAESQDAESASWFWVADAMVTSDVGDARAADDTTTAGRISERLLIFLWRIERTQAKVMNFRNAGSDLAIVDNPRGDWTTWRPRQLSIAHAVTAATDDMPRRGEVL